MFVPPLKTTENHDGVRLQQPSNLLISDGMKLCDRRSLGRWWITFTWVKKTPSWLVTVVAINQLWLGIMMGCNPVVRGYKGIIIYTGWWYNNHLEKYEFVNGKIIIPYIYIYEMENKNHVWNHQPAVEFFSIFAVYIWSFSSNDSLLLFSFPPTASWNSVLSVHILFSFKQFLLKTTKHLNLADLYPITCVYI